MQSDKHTILDVESCAAKATPSPKALGLTVETLLVLLGLHRFLELTPARDLEYFQSRPAIASVRRKSQESRR